MRFIGRTTRLIPHEHVVFRASGDGGILVNLRTGACFEVNSVGAEIWSRLAARDTIAATAETISLKYHVPAAVAETDVDRICREFLTMDLVTHLEEGPK